VLVEFPDAQRNKYGEYTKALSRILLGEELKLLFNAQRSLGVCRTFSFLMCAIW